MEIYPNLEFEFSCDYDIFSIILPAAATDSQALWFLHHKPHLDQLMQQPPFYRDTTCHR
ncbi:hypothetical protein AVEN_45673-1, partial [Araneus ventricosus]